MKQTFAQFQSFFADDPKVLGLLTAQDLPTRFEVGGEREDAQLEDLELPGVEAVDFCPGKLTESARQERFAGLATEQTSEPPAPEPGPEDQTRQEQASGAVEGASADLMTAEARSLRTAAFDQLQDGNLSGPEFSTDAVLVIQEADVEYSQPLAGPSEAAQSTEAQWTIDIDSFGAFEGPFDVLSSMQRSVILPNIDGESCVGPPIQRPEALGDVAYGVDFWSTEIGDFGCGAWTSYGIYTNEDGQIIAVTQAIFSP